jgi:hypothetical protein
MGESFGSLLQRFRVRAGLNVSELAEKVGASRTSIIEWEQGKRVPRAARRSGACPASLDGRGDRTRGGCRGHRQAASGQEGAVEASSVGQKDAGAALSATALMRHQLRTPLPDFVGQEAAIATLLDGMRKTTAEGGGYLPLALWVAGGLLHSAQVLQVADYLTRLSDVRQRLAHLRDPDDRQLDVAAALSLSYVQLDAQTQQLFRQVGVLEADFSTALVLDVVEIAGGADVEGLLHFLLRRNLVMYDAERARWRLHDLLRDLAWQQLEAAQEWESTMWRYARAIVSLAQTLQVQYRVGGDHMLAALTQFDVERAHIGAAWAWGMIHIATLDGDRLLLALAQATTLIGELRWDTKYERFSRLEGALGAAERLGQPDAQAWLLLNLGRAIFDLGNVQQAVAIWE